MNTLGLNSHSGVQHEPLKPHFGLKRKTEHGIERPAKKTRLSVSSEDHKKHLKLNNLNNSERSVKRGRTRTTILQSSGKVSLILKKSSL